MEYIEKIDKLLEESMTEKSFLLWRALKERIPNIWSRPTSSTGKYHRRKDGSVPSISYHVYEMLMTCIKLLSVFNLSLKTLDSDILLFSVGLHDIFKYGFLDPLNRKFTDVKHDQLVGNVIHENKSVFMRIFSESQVDLLETCCRYHSGRWSSNADSNFNFKDFPPEVMFVHLLDMLSTTNLIREFEESDSL